MFESESIWTKTGPTTSFPTLEGGRSAEVVVVGGGIAGLLTAALLAEQGKQVSVVEARKIASGTTGCTTGKLTVLHGLLYSKLTNRFGTDGATTYAQANRRGIEIIRELVQRYSIDCDLADDFACTYTQSSDGAAAIRAEVVACQGAGIDAKLVSKTSLPFKIAAGVQVDTDQALFHPTKFCAGLAEGLSDAGVWIHENSRVRKVVHSSDKVVIETDEGSVTASDGVMATQAPIVDRALLFTRTVAERSYAMAVRLTGKAPVGMYLSAAGPVRSIRPHPGFGDDALILGGEKHRVGEEADTLARFAIMEEWARRNFDIAKIEAMWSAQDYMPSDHRPFVGTAGVGASNTWVATGFQKWGLSNAGAAAQIITDGIVGRDNPWSGFFSSNRTGLRHSAVNVLKINVGTAKHLVGDRLKANLALSAKDLKPGQSAIVHVGGKNAAAYRDDAGNLHAVSAACTHLGCLVNFNTAERTWDCPCHGSRFAIDGTVLQGPATKDLHHVEVEL